MARQNGTRNLIPTNRRSKEEAKEISRRGGIESGKARKKKKDLKEALELLLLRKPNAEVKAFIKSALGIDAESLFDAMHIKQIEKAVKSGDTSAYNAVADRVMGKPKQEIEQVNINKELPVTEEDEKAALDYARRINSKGKKVIIKN